MTSMPVVSNMTAYLVAETALGRSRRRAATDCRTDVAPQLRGRIRHVAEPPPTPESERDMRSFSYSLLDEMHPGKSARLPLPGDRPRS